MIYTKLQNKFNNKFSGFTLIELLVVITIIGILSTVVIVNLNSARTKGQDTAIKEQMAQIRTIAAFYLDKNDGYSATAGLLSYATYDCLGSTAAPGVVNSSLAGTVFSDPSFLKAAYGIYRNSSVMPKCYIGSSVAGSKVQSWAMTAKLKSPTLPSGLWCVDSSGMAVENADGNGAVVNGNGVTFDYTCQ